MHRPTQPLPLPADLLDVSAVARMLKTHVSCIYRQIHSGKLPAYRIGGRWRLSLADVRGFVRRTGPAAVVAAAKEGRTVERITHEDAVALLRQVGVMRD